MGVPAPRAAGDRAAAGGSGIELGDWDRVGTGWENWDALGGVHRATVNLARGLQGLCRGGRGAEIIDHIPEDVTGKSQKILEYNSTLPNSLSPS